MSDNIISFPKIKNFGVNNSLNNPSLGEELKENIQMLKAQHCQDFLNFVVPIIFHQMYIAGFDFDFDDENMIEGAFIIESIRSVIYKYYGLPHPFQEINDDIFEVEEDGLRIVDELYVNFNGDYDVVLEEDSEITDKE